MDWLSDLFHWFVTSPSGWWVFSITYCTGLLIFATGFIWHLGDVRPGPDPAPREVQTVEFTIRPALPVAANYWRDDPFPLEEFLSAVDEATTVVIDLTDTVVIEPVIDPLADTVELRMPDEDTPLFYTIRRPAPYVAESFTQGLTRAQIERAIAAGRPE